MKVGLRMKRWVDRNNVTRSSTNFAFWAGIHKQDQSDMAIISIITFLQCAKQILSLCACLARLSSIPGTMLRL